jgi:branched-chain amino acid transport system substrate-binding protein
VDPDLTNSKCSYWHFRLDADTSMKMEALTTYMKDLPEVKKVYLINQNYSHGQQVSKYAKEMMARKRPDVQFVGDDLHPLAQVRDFAPYIAKIKASAQTA